MERKAQVKEKIADLVVALQEAVINQDSGDGSLLQLLAITVAGEGMSGETACREAASHPLNPVLSAKGTTGRWIVQRGADNHELIQHLR